MKNSIITAFLLIFLFCSQDVISQVQVESADKEIKLDFFIENDSIYYSVDYSNHPVIYPSKLGFEFQNKKPLADNLKVIKVTKLTLDTTWEQVWGEQRKIRNTYNEAFVELEESKGLKRKMNLRFRVFNDGVAFRYEIPSQEHMQEINITNELTQFAMHKNLNAWFIPAHFDSYEALYQHLPISQVESANTPITFQSTEEDIFISIHEANLTDYAGMTLKKKDNSTTVFEANLVPWPDGIKVKTNTSMKSPWRTIQIGSSAEALAESNIILNLNEPNRIKNTSWIRPTKYVGVWWEMHIGTHTWTEGNRHGATTQRMKDYIDFAAAHNMESVLAEGWSTGWENWGVPRAFDFVTPYPDFDMDTIVAYAKEKGIQLIGHHETGGDAEYYEEQMDTAFRLYKSLGIHHLKTGYAGAIVPTGQHHHGQYMVNHYRKVVETAAHYQLNINAHEPIKPTGIRRTYPNMMCREGARGMEWNGWSDGNPPEHHTILPFTRILGGPLDYTPGIFDLLYKNAENRVKWNGNDKGTSRTNTTLSKQLALFVVLYSPWQMAADQIHNYKGHPAFKFISDIPVNWEFTKFLNASIGEYVTVVRKDWESDDWYLGSITNEAARSLEIELSFLDKGETYIAEIYKDSAKSDWKTNPYPYAIVELEVTSGYRLTLTLAPGGGQAIRFSKKIEKE